MEGEKNANNAIVAVLEGVLLSLFRLVKIPATIQMLSLKEEKLPAPTPYMSSDFSKELLRNIEKKSGPSKVHAVPSDS